MSLSPLRRTLELIAPLDALFTPLSGGKWIPPKDAVLFACSEADFQGLTHPGPATTLSADAAVAAALLQEGVPVVPVSEQLQKLLVDNGASTAQVTPAFVRARFRVRETDWTRSIPFAELQSAHPSVTSTATLMMVLKYCMRDATGTGRLALVTLLLL